MHSASELHYSYEDYLQALDDSAIKLEYCAGIIYAMAGGTLAHAELSGAIIRIFGQLLLGRCVVLTSDAKVRVESSDFAGFPDASIVCGTRQTSRIDANALVNPTLIVEVTSRSTEAYDRGEKLSHYQRIASLDTVVFVSHRERRVTVVSRNVGWTSRDFSAGEVVEIPSPAVSFEIDQLYQGITLDPN